MPVEIDFTRIRPHGGSRDLAFEELCCQLAGLEPKPPGSAFHRKGPGGDAGVECFLSLADGGEVGWQAKYFFQLGRAQVAQLDESIESALAKHLRLQTYIVCIPFDLRDSRTGKGTTELARWQQWRERRTALAARASRRLDVQLWPRSSLLERLTRDHPLYAGRLAYWFRDTVLTPSWFAARFAQSRAALGARYTPETNVELPVRKCLLAFSRDPELAAEIAKCWRTVEKRRHEAVADLGRLPEAAGLDLASDLERATAALAAALQGCAGTRPELPLQRRVWQDAAALAGQATQAALAWLIELPRPGPAEDGRTRVPEARARAQRGLFRLASAVRGCRDLCDEEHVRLANHRRLLVHGAAGLGKSHLLADAAAHRLEAAKPTLLLLGGTFVEGDPWRQVLEQLDLGDLLVRDFLGALDAAAEAAGARAVLFIDAINERHGLDLWPSRLGAFLAQVEPYPRVGVAVSCRTTYLYAFEDAVPEAEVPRLEHRGFAGTDGEAARRYLELRGIVRPGSPSFSPEFDNPLFLRTCCDLLERQGTRVFLSLRLPPSRSAWRTQFQIDCAVGSNSRERSSGVRPERTNSTICRRNSGG